MTEKLHISWEEFHRDTRELCAKIKNSGNYDKIVAVSRGGLCYGAPACRPASSPMS